MSHNLDKIVKLACKPKNAPPKAKYVDVLIAATYSDDGSLQDIVRSLSLRVREPNAVVVFKALLTLHQMIRSGSTEQLLDLLSKQDVLKLRNIASSGWEGFTPPASMSAYARYLDSRIKCYKEIRHDLVRVQAESNRRSDGQGAASKARRLRNLPVDRGLLREVKQVQSILDVLIQCKFYDDDLRDENTVLAFRMLVKDLLVLFQAGNEGVCNILEHYFEMSKVDATESFDIYKSFIKQTDKVVDYLGIARKLNNVVNVPVPNLKHAPTGLVKALEEYLNDPNFENNRLEYKKSLGVVEGNSTSGREPSPAAQETSAPKESKPSTSTSTAPAPPSSPPPAQAPPGASQKIQDFFESIQSTQQPTMFGGPAQPNYTQMTMNQAAFNPFRQSMMMPQQTGFMQPQMTGFPMQQSQQQFMQTQMTGAMAFGQQQPQGMQSQPTGAPNGFMPQQQTGFMQPQPQANQQAGFLQPQATGANPFRQSMMLNTSVGPSGAMSQPASPFGNNAFGVNGFGQIQRPGSTPAQSNATTSAKPLTAQPTGTKNPFAPAGGIPPVPQQQRGPSMNELMMGGGHINSQPTGMNSPWGGFSGQQQAQAQPPQQQAQQANAGGSGMSDIASAFSFGNDKPSSSNTDFLSQFGSGAFSSGGTDNKATSTSASSSSNATSMSHFGSLSSNPTGATSPSISSQSTGFLQPQPTGYGGSNIKPFKPTSSFGSQLLESLPPISEPGSTPTKSPSAGVQPQSTGFPGMNLNGGGAGQQSLSPQMTGANPFRQSTFGNLGGGGGSTSPFPGQMGAQATGFGGAFGTTPFGGHNAQPGGQGGMNQFGMFGQQGGQGQGQGGQSGGSLI
ncbi:hypothetical protein IAU60_006760 [Kwoniella sp. DSM 27419]